MRAVLKEDSAFPRAEMRVGMACARANRILMTKAQSATAVMSSNVKIRTVTLTTRGRSPLILRSGDALPWLQNTARRGNNRDTLARAVAPCRPTKNQPLADQYPGTLA